MYLHPVRSYTFSPTLHVQSSSILITNLPCEDLHRLVLVVDGSDLAPCTIAFHLKRFAHNCWCDERDLPYVARTSLLWMTEAKMEPRTARSKPRHTTVCDASKKAASFSVFCSRQDVATSCGTFLSEQHDIRSLHFTLLLLRYFSEWRWQPPDLPPSSSSQFLRAFPSLAPTDRHPSHRFASLLRKCCLSQYTNVLRPKKKALLKPTARTHSTRHCQILRETNGAPKAREVVRGQGGESQSLIFENACSKKGKEEKAVLTQQSVTCHDGAWQSLLARETSTDKFN